METKPFAPLTEAPPWRFEPRRRLDGAFKGLAVPFALAASALITIPSQAADGCLVMLCLAAPSWSSIVQCVDPVRQVLRDLARGRPFPDCAMSGAGNTASNRWSNPPGYCPAQYTRLRDWVGDTAYECVYAAAVEVDVNGTLWARTWWSFSGDSVTEFSPAAKAQMPGWNPRFDDDYARWLAAQPPPPPPCPTCQ